MSKRLLMVSGLLAAIFSVAMAFGGSSAAAQDEGTYDLTIGTLQCEDSSCDPETNEFIGDITVYVTSEDGSVDYGSCTTDYSGTPGGCSVAVDPSTTVQVTVDEATIPEGYVALDYPVIYDVPAEKTTVDDVNLYFSPQEDTVPDDADTDEEVDGGAGEGEEAIEGEADAPAEEVEGAADGTPAAAAELPSTGSGESNGAAPANLPMLLLAAVAALGVIATGGVVLSRRMLNDD